MKKKKETLNNRVKRPSSEGSSSRDKMKFNVNYYVVVVSYNAKKAKIPEVRKCKI